ncbi:hypothetical protein HPB47_022841, partial [Ixodes persulcatus]
PTDKVSANKGKISALLSGVVPGKLKEIRFNSRRNIVAVDVLSEDALPDLLGVNDVCGTKVSAHIPSGVDITMGVVRDIDKDLTKKEVFKTM